MELNNIVRGGIVVLFMSFTGLFYAIDVWLMYHAISNQNWGILTFALAMFAIGGEILATVGCNYKSMNEAEEKLYRVNHPPVGRQRFYTQGRILEVETSPVEIAVDNAGQIND